MQTHLVTTESLHPAANEGLNYPERGLDYKNGLMIVSRFSISWLCCKSSEYKVLQLASSADDIMILSNSWKSYLLIKKRAFSKAKLLIGMILQYDNTLLHFHKTSFLGSFCNLLVTFKNSETT